MQNYLYYVFSILTILRYSLVMHIIAEVKELSIA